jgi:hypothetical protein
MPLTTCGYQLMVLMPQRSLQKKVKDWSIDLFIYCALRHFQQYFSYFMATSFSCGRNRSTWREPSTMDKQLINFITCGCESRAPFLQFTKLFANPRRIGILWITIHVGMSFNYTT